MAEVVGIIASLFTAGQMLESFAQQTRKWKLLSDRLFDLREGLEDIDFALARWKHRYQVEERHRRIYMEVLFGKQGCERITNTLGSIRIITRDIQEEINKLVGRALQVRFLKAPLDGNDNNFDEILVKDCLHRIRQNTSWSQKFALSVLGKADDLERATEHPEIYTEITRLPGRRVILKVGDRATDGLAKHLKNSNAAREDARFLHKVSGEGNRIHIGHSVPQLGERDFDFLLNLEGRTDEVLVRPVKIKAVNNSSRVKGDFATAAPALRSNPNADLYVLLIATSSDGFHIKLPAANHLVDLEHKESLATVIKNRDSHLGSQILYPQDQSAIASGIAQGALRHIGSRWMKFLDCSNIRWRRAIAGQRTSMLTAAPGNALITRSLDQCYTSNRAGRGSRDLTKHIQIFRTGLVLAEIALKFPVSYVDYDPSTNTIKLFINDGEEVDADDVAAAVERESNIFLGNIVYYCLNVLQDRDKMKDSAIEADYYREVVKDAKELNDLMQMDRRRGDKSPVIAGIDVV